MTLFGRIFARRRLYDDLSAEIEEHLEEKIEELVAAGMSREEASLQARRDFGNAPLIEEHGREAWQWRAVESLLRDTKYAFRQLRRNPGFALTVILTLSLAIGANTAVFTLVNTMLLRPLPYPEPEKLASLNRHQDGIDQNGKFASYEQDSQDGETWELLRDNVLTVTAGAWDGATGVNLQAGGKARYVRDQRVSARFFDALGIAPLQGRSFTEEEDRPAGPKAVILGFELWRTLFASDPQILGKSILLKGEPHPVVGVMPKHTQVFSSADLWTPLQPSRFGEGSGDNYGIVLRLRPGATWTQLNTQLAQLRPAMMRNFEKAQPQGHTWLFAAPLQQELAREKRTPVLLLMGAAGFILLIACANLAGLMLVRIGRRSGEIATRLAIGASRRDIARQLLIEPLILALGGGLVGAYLAAIALDSAGRLLPPGLLPAGALTLDLRVIGFSLAITLCTSLLIAVLPILELRRVEIRSFMGAGGKTVAFAGRRRTRQFLIAGEVALTVVLLAGAGLLIRTLVHLQTLPPGFDGNNVLSAKVSLDDVRYHDAVAFRKLLQQSVSAMQRIPGVQAAAVGLSLPFERGLNDGMVIMDGPHAGEKNMSSAAYVTPDYFHVLRIPVLAGRAFSDSDTAESEPVVVVNENLARSYFGSADAIGRHFRSGKTTYTVVGLVSNVTKRPGLRLTAPLGTEPTYYMPATQVSGGFLGLIHVWFQPSWIVRTDGPIAGLNAAMERAMAETDPNLPFAGFYGLRDLQVKALQEQRSEVLLLGVLAALALLLSLVGIYGLVSNMVTQRTREIGIRMALGANVSQAMAEVGKSGMASAGCGLIGGLVLAALTLRLVESQLYGVRAYDPLTLILVCVVLAVAAMAASFAPTLRIARIDPAATLRAE